MFDQLFSRSRAVETGVGVHGDGSSDLPISNCISGELGGVGMSIGYSTYSSPSVPTIITIVTAKTIYEDSPSDSLISVVPTRSEPEEEASSSQTPTRSFTASGFLAAIFGIGIALSFWTPKNLWVFMGGFGLRREKRKQRNQQAKRTVGAREEVRVNGNKLTSGQKDKGKARAIEAGNEGESSASAVKTEQTPLLVGAGEEPSTYSSGVETRDSGIDLTNSEEARATRSEDLPIHFANNREIREIHSEELPIHHEPLKSPESEVTDDEMLETIEEAEEVEPQTGLPNNETWSFADHKPSPTPSVRAESPVQQVGEGSMVIIPPAATLEDPDACPYDRRMFSAEPLPASVVADLPANDGEGFRESRSLTPVNRALPVESSAASSVRAPSLSRGVSNKSSLKFSDSEKVEAEEVPAKVVREEVKAGPSEVVEVPKVKEVETPKVEKIEAPKVEEVVVPKVEEVVAPKVVEAVAPKAKEVESPMVEEVRAAAIEEVVIPRVEEVEKPKAEVLKVETPKAKEVEAPKVEAPKIEAPKVEAPKVEAPKVEAPKVEAPKVEAPKVEAPKVEAPEVEAPKVETPKEAPIVETSKVETPKVEAPKVEAPKVEKVIEEPKEEVLKKEEQEVKPTPVATPSSTPQIDLIPPTPAPNSGFSQEVTALLRSGQTGEEEEDEADSMVKDHLYRKSLSGSTEALPQVTEEPEPTLAQNKGKERADDDVSIIDQPMTHSPDQISLNEEAKEGTQKDEAHLDTHSTDEIPRPTSAKPPSTLGDDKSTRSESSPARRTSIRRMAGIGHSSHSRAPSVDSMKKDSSLRRSLTSVFPGKKMKRENSAPPSTSSSQVKLGELTPPPTPPETIQDVARPESSRRSEKEKSSISRAMSWNNAMSKLSSKEKREQAKQSSDLEAAGKSGDGADTTEVPKSSSASIISHKEGRPRTSDGKSINGDKPSKLPRRPTWSFSKRKSSQNLSLADVAKAASASAAASTTSLVGPKNEEVAQPTTEAVVPLDKGKGVDRTPVEAPKPTEPAPVATEDVKIIEAPPPPPPAEQEQKQPADEAAAAAAAATVVADQKPPPRPMLKSRVTSMMAWGRKKK